MKFGLATLGLAALAEASPFYGWYAPVYAPVVKLGPKHEWVEGYGYAIPQAKAAEERKKREADAAVLGSASTAPDVPLVAAPYAAPVPHALLAAGPHSATVEHVGTEVIPGAVTEGEPVALPGVVPVGYAAHPYGYGLWGRKKREAEAKPEAEAAADAYYGYYGHPGYYGGRYYGLGYRGYYGHGYGFGYYGKK